MISRAASVLAVVLLATVASGQVPGLINYQGRLLNETNLINGELSLILRLYSQANGGSLLYEDSNTVAVVDGLYSTQIGDGGSPIPLAWVLTNQEVWIEVAVDGITFRPRERLAAVGYAIMADGVSTGAITTAMLSDAAVTSAKIANGSITSFKIAGGAVQSNHLAVGAVQSNHLALGAVHGQHIAAGAIGPAQLANGAVTSNKLAAGAVGAVQLATPYEAGVIPFHPLYLTNQVAFTNWATNVSVNFSTPFGATPVVVAMLDSTNPAATAVSFQLETKTPTGFVMGLEFPAVSAARVAQCSVLKYETCTLVNGRPAMAYMDRDITDGDHLYYQQALDVRGYAWEAPIMVATATTLKITSFSLAEIGGYPAMVWNHSATGMMYSRAQNLAATNWVAPVWMGTNGSYVQLFAVGGNPAVAFSLPNDRGIGYLRADDPIGSSWPAVVVANTNADIEALSVAIVGANPAIAFCQDYPAVLHFTHASDLAGNAWPAESMIIHTSVNYGVSMLRLGNGYAALAFSQYDNDNLYFASAANVAGSAWNALELCHTNGDAANASLCLVDDYPAVAFSASNAIWYTRAYSTNGSAWPSTVQYLYELDSVAGLGLTMADGCPAVMVGDNTADAMIFLRAGTPPTDAAINWIAVKP